MDILTISDPDQVLNIFTHPDITLTQGEGILITNNGNNELLISQQVAQPSNDFGYTLKQGMSASIPASVNTPVWITGARGDIIVQRSVDSINESKGVELPLSVWSSLNPRTRRLQVDVSETGFEEGREFRVSYPLSIPTSSRAVLKFSAPVDFRIHLQTLFVDAQGIVFEAFRDTQGVESGIFGTTVPVFDINFESTSPVYARQVQISTGGDFIPDGGEVAVETIRLRVANASGQATTVGGSQGRKRGIPAADYYLVFTNITGTGTALGVYSLEFEERPSQFS